MWRRATTSRSGPALAAAATAVIGALFLVLLAASRDHEDDAGTGTVPVGPVAGINDRVPACQRRFPLSGESVDRVTFVAQPASGPATVEVTIRPSGGGAELARARLALSTDASGQRTVPIRRIDRDGLVDVCFRAVGTRDLVLYGEGVERVPGNSSTDLYSGGKPQPGDAVLTFERSDRASTLHLLPVALQRAARWRPGFVGAWTYWLGIALALVAAPFLLVRALAGAIDEDDALPPSDG